MALKLDFLRFLMVLLFVGAAPTLSLAGNITPTPLIEQVCNTTKIYDFCVSTIYSDPNAEFFNRTDLANFIFRLTDDKADIFRSFLEAQPQRSAAMKMCLSDYAVIDGQISRGLSDMHTDKYQNLKQYSMEMAKSVLHCQLELVNPFPELLQYNHLVKSVIEICISVGGLFSSE